MDCHAIWMRMRRHGFRYRKLPYFLINRAAFDRARRGRKLETIAELADLSIYSLDDYLYHGHAAPLEKAYSLADALDLPIEKLWKEKK